MSLQKEIIDAKDDLSIRVHPDDQYAGEQSMDVIETPAKTPKCLVRPTGGLAQNKLNGGFWRDCTGRTDGDYRICSKCWGGK